MTGYRLLLEKEVIEAWRTYRLGVVAALFVVLGIAVPVLTRYLPEIVRFFAPSDFEIGLPDMGPADVVDQLVRMLVQFGSIAAVLVAMGSVAGERARGTAALVVSKRVTRFAYVWSKFVAMAMVLGLGTGLAVLAAWLYTGLVYGVQPSLPWIQLALVVWLALLVPAALTLLGSTVAPTPLGAGAFGVAVLVALSLVALVPTLTAWLPPGLLDVARAAALEEVSPDLDPPRTILASIVVVVAALGLAWARFRRVDL